MPLNQRERYCGRVSWNSNDRFCYGERSEGGLDHGNRPPEQRSSQHEGAFPAYRGNHLIYLGLIAPDENVPLFDHSSEKILILSRQKVRSERLRACREDSRFQQHVVGPSLPPVDNESRWVSRPLVELALDDPLWRLFVEVPLHWSEHAVHSKFITGLEQSQQPSSGRKLVVVDEGDKVPVRVLNGLVPRQRDILPRLHAVLDRNTRRSRKVPHHCFARLQMIVVGNHDRIREQSARILTVELLQQAFEKARTLIRANAHADMLRFVGHLFAVYTAVRLSLTTSLTRRGGIIPRATRG